MFTKQHYEKVAEVLRDTTPRSVVVSAKVEANYDMHWDIVQAFADMFESDNPNFDRQKFLKAVTS